MPILDDFCTLYGLRVELIKDSKNRESLITATNIINRLRDQKTNYF